MPALALRVKLKGPLARIGGAPIRRAMEATIRDLTQKGTDRLDEQARPRPGGVFLSVAQARRGKASTGHYRRNIHSRVSGLHGLITDGRVVYGPWLETGGRGTRFRGYFLFRKTKQWIETQRQRVTQSHVARAVRELGGR